MSESPRPNQTLDDLKAENDHLRIENERLRREHAARAERHKGGHGWRSAGAALLLGLAVVLLVVGNVLFWTGNTVVKADRFADATAPVVRDQEVQQAVAAYTTQQLFSNVDVERAVTDALPQQAQFLAPTIATELRGGTERALQKVLARPQFQDRWNNLLQRSQTRFIDVMRQSGGDGTIDLNDLYQSLSDTLKDTRLSFLADKQLPPKVGNVQIASGSGIQVMHQVVAHINTWRLLAILLFLLFAFLGVYLARSRRRAVVWLAFASVVGMLITLVGLRVVGQVFAGRVDGAYADAVDRTAQIVFHPLVVQTVTLLVFFLLVAVVAWLTGASRSAHYVQGRVQLLVAGKLHYALFSEHENAFTSWVGRHRRVLEWIAVGIAVVLMLVTRLTLGALLAYVIAVVIVILLIELFSAPTSRSR